MSTEDEPVIRPFADWLREQAKGHSHEEFGENLHELIARVRETGKKGQLHYIVNVELMKDSPDMIVVKDEIKLKLPEFDREASLFYPDAQGNLTRNDPNQLAFEGMRVLPPPPVADFKTGEIREDNTSS